MIRDKIKRNLHTILIVFGIIMMIIVSSYHKINNTDIESTDSWAEFIGFILFALPLFSGLWLYSIKIKHKKKKISFIIKFFIVMITSMVYIFLNIFIVEQIIATGLIINYFAIILLNLVIGISLYFLLRKKRLNRDHMKNLENRSNGLIKYFKEMRNKAVKIPFLIIGLTLSVWGTFNFINFFKSYFVVSNYIVTFIDLIPFCIGFALLGAFLLFVSKDIKESKKNLSLVFKLLGWFWIIGGCLNLLAVILQYIIC